MQIFTNLFYSKATPLKNLKDFMGVKVSVKRDDLNHRTIQGNKLRKLKYNLKSAVDNNCQTLVTFGGAWSNHIVATAYAAQIVGLKSIGFIRGDELENKQNKWSATLKLAQQYGMSLKFLTRKEYREKNLNNRVKSILNELADQNLFMIPEGGSNDLAVKGVVEIIDELTTQLIKPPTHIITACGTGGTVAGLIDGVALNKWKTLVMGIPVLKGAQFLVKDIEKLSNFHQQVKWSLNFDYHAGGYGKTNKELLDFGQRFRQQSRIKLDKIYTVKSFFASHDLIKKGIIKQGSHVIILHTGGLQGGEV